MKFNLQKHILDKNLFRETETIIVALSGGVDSMVLFHVLYNLNMKLNLVIAHVNHNKRSESLNEYQELQLMAKEYNVQFEGLELDSDLEGNFQSSSRTKRFEFFSKVAHKYGSSKVVLAHHEDDQVETVLMRIARGSSLIGYAGIKDYRKENGVHLYRPLLDVSKEKLRNYAKENSLSYFEDWSNKEDAYTRNRFRNNIIPLIEEEQSNLGKKIDQFTDYIVLADDFIEKHVKSFIREYFRYNKINVDVFNHLDEIIKIKVIKYMINKASNNKVEVSYAQYKAIINMVKSDTPNTEYSLSNEYRFIREYNQIYVVKHEKKESVFLEIKGLGEYIVSKELKYIFTSKKMDFTHSIHFELCYNREVFPLYLRSRQNGDKMSLKVGTKKVKDILIDQKIPHSIRENLILLSDNDKVLWIPGIKKSLIDETCIEKLYIYEVK